MKEEFIRAEMEIVEFEVEDIITTSGTGNDNIDDGPIVLPFIPLG